MRVRGSRITRCGAAIRAWRARRAARSLGVCVIAGFALGLVAAPAAPAKTPKTVWLCKASNGPCGKPLTTTIVETNGHTSVEKAKKASHPAINCFYVYPTVTEQEGTNANLKIEATETAVAEAQASRFSQDCKVYAPMYPQVTLKTFFESPSVLEKAFVTA